MTERAKKKGKVVARMSVIVRDDGTADVSGSPYLMLAFPMRTDMFGKMLMAAAGGKPKKPKKTEVASGGA